MIDNLALCFAFTCIPFNQWLIISINRWEFEAKTQWTATFVFKCKQKFKVILLGKY